MSDAAVPAAPAPPTPKASKKVKNVKKSASHPPYIDMIKKSIEKSGDRKGISRQAIIKYIGTNYSLSTQDNVLTTQVRLALRRGVESGALKQLKGTGASGSFRVASGNTEEIKKKKPAPKGKAKRPKAAIKKTAKKVVKKVKKVKSKSLKKVKKPAVKKSPRPQKKVVKKTAPKKK